MLSFNLALKLFMRDFKSGELRVLMFALWVAVAGLITVTLLVDRVERGMTKEASQVLGANRVMYSPQAIDAEIAEEAQLQGLQTSESLWFSSVILANDQFQLTTVKAVDHKFPLAGELKIAQALFEAGEVIQGKPQSGNVWLSPRLFNLLNIKLGDSVQIGAQTFIASGVIAKEPGGSSFFNFAPSVMMSVDDVAATQVIQPGSRLDYRLALTGSESSLESFDSWIKTQLNKSQRYLRAESGAPQLGNALSRAKKYLNLSGVLALLLGGIAIAIAANRYSLRHFDHCALLRCMGLKKDQVLFVFVWILLLVGTVGTSLGALTGWAVNEGLMLALKELLPEQVPPVRIETFVLGMAAGFIVLIGFALPSLIRIRSVQPMRILRKDLEPFSLAMWASILMAIFALSVVISLYSPSITIVAIMIVGGGFVAAISLVASLFLLKLISRLSQNRSMAFRFGVEHLKRHRAATLIQVSAFGLTLTLLLIILLVRNELIQDWKQQLPQDAPNHFLVNIQPEKVDALNQLFTANNLVSQGIFPMVRGRVVELNGEKVTELYKDKELHNSLRRELNLTWMEAFPEANELLEGQWLSENPQKIEISIEEEMAKRLELVLGSTMTFRIGADELTAEVTSIRKVKWDSFQPNFYVIFNKSALENMPATFISSFYLAPEQKMFLNDLVKLFPTVSVIELDLILAEVRRVIEKASLAVEVVLIFVMLSGIAVLLATTRSSLDDKLYESALLKTLGANRKFVAKTTFSEYWLLGLLSGVLAAISSEFIAFLLYEFVFKMEAQLHWWIWVTAPIIALLAVVPAGTLGSRSALKEPPSQVLNNR